MKLRSSTINLPPRNSLTKSKMDDDLFEEQSALKKSPEKKSEDNKESSDPIGFPIFVSLIVHLHLHFGYFKHHPIQYTLVFTLDQIFYFLDFLELLNCLLGLSPFTSLVVLYLSIFNLFYRIKVLRKLTYSTTLMDLWRIFYKKSQEL